MPKMVLKKKAVVKQQPTVQAKPVKKVVKKAVKKAALKTYGKPGIAKTPFPFPKKSTEPVVLDSHPAPPNCADKYVIVGISKEHGKSLYTITTKDKKSFTVQKLVLIYWKGGSVFEFNEKIYYDLRTNKERKYLERQISMEAF